MESVRGTSYFLQVIWGKQCGIPESNHPYPLDPRRWHWVGWQTQPLPALWFCSPQCQISFVCSSFVCLFLSSGQLLRTDLCLQWSKTPPPPSPTPFFPPPLTFCFTWFLYQLAPPLCCFVRSVLTPSTPVLFARQPASLLILD